MTRGWVVDGCAVGFGAGLAVLHDASFPLDPNPIMRILIFLGLFALPFALVAAARVVVRRDYPRIGLYSLVLAGPLSYLVSGEMRRAKLPHSIRLVSTLLPLLLGLVIWRWADWKGRRRPANS